MCKNLGGMLKSTGGDGVALPGCSVQVLIPFNAPVFIGYCGGRQLGDLDLTVWA